MYQEQTIRLPLAGNLARVEARGIFVHIQIGNLAPVRLAFAWAQASMFILPIPDRVRLHADLVSLYIRRSA
jgi:hypothetical protein